MKRGRPFEPGNKFGRGRPKGSPNKKKQSAEKMLDDNSPAITALAINTAREDRPMLRTLFSQVVRRMSDRTVKLGNLPMKTFQDLDRASEVVLSKVVAGKLSVGEGPDVCGMIEIRRQVLMSVNVEGRLSALENGGQAWKEAA